MTTSDLLLPPQRPTAPPQSYSHPADRLASYSTEEIGAIVTELPQAPASAPLIVPVVMASPPLQLPLLQKIPWTDLCTLAVSNTCCLIFLWIFSLCPHWTTETTVGKSPVTKLLSCLHFLGPSAALYTAANSLLSDTFSSLGFQDTILWHSWSFPDYFSVFPVRSPTHNGALGLRCCISYQSTFTHTFSTPTSIRSRYPTS